jgi:cytochrome P450
LNKLFLPNLGDGKVIPKEVNVGVIPYTLHRDPKVFPDPEAFVPERFSATIFSQDGIHLQRNPYAYIPFSAGPRNCIGQKFALLEEKVVLAKLFLNFNIHTLHRTKEEVKMLPNVILRPFRGVHIKISPRTRFS